MMINKQLRFAGANAVLAIFYFMFVRRYWGFLVDQPRLSHLLLLATSSLICVFAIIRKDPEKVEHSPVAFAAIR